MKVVLLAGGQGTRLHPLTLKRPKPLVPICLQPLLGHVLHWLEQNNLNDVLVVLLHQADMIERYLAEHQTPVKIETIRLPEDWGTAGALKQVAHKLSESFLVINADLLSNMPLQPIQELHLSRDAWVTVGLTRVKNPTEYGVVILDKEQRVEKFLEKPVWSEVFSDTVNGGIYCFSPRVFEHIPDGAITDISRHLIPKLLSQGQRVYGSTPGGYWKDVGDISEYRQVHIDLLNGESGFALPSNVVTENGWEKALVHPEADVAPGIQIIRSVVGRKTIIAPGTRIVDSVIGEGVVIGQDTSIEQAVVLDRVKIGPRVQLHRGAVVAENSVIGEESIVKPYIRIWPDKEVEPGAVVSSPVIWRERFRKSLFNAWGISGKCNVEITPEFAATLGAAFGATLGKGKRVITSWDGHRASRMIYRGIIAGVVSTGVNVSTLDAAPIPLTRYELKALSGSGGFHVRCSPYDPQAIDIKFFDENALDLSTDRERLIERNFFGEGFPRVSLEDVGELSFPAYRVTEQYREGFLAHIDEERIQRRRFRIVLDYAHGTAYKIFPSILGQLQCDVIAINAHPDDRKITKTREEFEKSLAELSQIVQTLQADFGVMLDAGAEKIFLCDDQGKIMSGTETLLVMLRLHGIHQPLARVAIPVHATTAAEPIVEMSGGVVSRTKVRTRSFIETGIAEKCTMLGEPTGGFVFPDFLEAFDAMFAIAKLMEYLASSDKPLSSFHQDLPKNHVLERRLQCEDEDKPRLLRKLSEQTSEAKIQLLDGVRWVWPNRWALFLPDPDKPELQIFSEAETPEETVNLADSMCSVAQGYLR